MFASRRMALFGVLVVAFAGIGCGGSGGGTTTPGGGDNRIGFGPLQGRGVLRGFVDTISTTTTTATAIPGTFTELNLIQQGTSTAESIILLGKGGFLRAWQGDGTNERTIVPGRFRRFSATQDGRFVFAVELRPNLPDRIVRIDMWNNTLLPITSPLSNQDDNYPRVIDDQSGIVWVRSTAGGDNRIFRANLTGTSGTSIRQIPANIKFPAIFDNTLYYWMSNSAYTGPTTVNATDSIYAGANLFQQADYSPNGLSQAAIDSNTVVLLLNFRGIDILFKELATIPAGTEASDLLFSPNGRELLWVTNQFSDLQPDPLRALNLQTLTYRTISNEIGSSSLPGVGWVPGRTFYPLVGTTVDHLLGNGSDGVIFTRQDERVTGIVSFDATTPAAVVMKAETGGNQNPDTLAYSVDADAISLVRYANGPTMARINVVGAGAQIANCTGFLVDFDNDTGRVGLVLPYTAQRGVSRSVREENGARVFRGEFLGVFDKDGKNLAPSGAREVRVSGERVEVR